MLKTKTGRAVIAVALLLGLYALAGFVAVPRILRGQLIDAVRTNLGVTPTVGEIRFDPFRLQLEVRNVALPDRSGAPLAGFDRLFVAFEFSSLWHRALVFRDIEIASPYLHAVVAPGGALNLLQLKPQTPPRPVPAARPGKPQSAPTLRIAAFAVSHGTVTYDDRSRRTPFATRLEPIDFELHDFSTGADGGLFTFSGFSKLGERIEWHGHLSVQPLESDGRLQIDKLRAQTPWSYVEDSVAFAVGSGTIDLAANYRFSLVDAVNLAVDGLQIAVTDLAVRPKGADADWVVVPSLRVDGGSADTAKRAAHVDSVVFTGLQVRAWREPDGSLNLMKLAAPVTATGATPTPAAPAAPSAAAAGPPWRFDLGEFAIRDASFSAEDRTTTPAAKLTLAPFALRVTGATSNPAQPVGVVLNTRINGNGELGVTGEMTAQPTAADLSIKLAGIELKALQPYLDQRTSMELKSGRLSGDATLRYGAGTTGAGRPAQGGTRGGKRAAQPALAVVGRVSIDDLRTVDDALHDDFISWARLDIDGLKFTQAPERLDIERIVARKPYARIIIESDTTLNVARVLAGPAGASKAAALQARSAVAAGATATLPAPAGVAAAASVAAPGAGRRRGVAAARAPATKSGQPAPPALPMAVHRIVVESGTTNFSDLSIQPNFSAGIQALGGTVTGFSTRPGARAAVNLHGEVGPFAPVTIQGDVGVGGALYADLALSFRNIELSIFNPYSGKFAGYDIAKGKLTTDLHYKVVGRALDARHHVSIDQLEFGEKTASKDAVSLPVKLAVSLLKDRNGVIDLDVPVTGSLDDPQFKLGPIIWKIVLNLLVKAVTAPFALLGSLFGGGPEMQFVDFRAGDSALDGPAAEKVKSMAKALAARPQLKLEVPIAVLPEIDRPALVDGKYRAELQAQMQAKPAGRNAAAAAPPAEFTQLEPKLQLSLLTAVYERQFGARPKFPPPPADAAPDGDRDAGRIRFLAAALKDHVVVADSDLQALAQQRATVLQQALLTDGQVDPARVFLVVNGKAKAQDGQARLELALQ